MRSGVVIAAAGLGLAIWLFLSMRDSAPQRAAGRPAPQPETVERAEAGPARSEASTAASLAWTGRAIDIHRSGVAGARVVLRLPDGPTREASTDAHGRFELRGGERPEKGEVHFHVEVSHSGRGLRRTVTVKPGSPDEIDLGLLRLAEVASLRVVVMGDGKPVAGARVVSGPRYLPGPVARTGIDGSVSLSLLAAGTVEVRAAAEGFGRGATSVDVPRETEAIVLLPPERVLTLIVQEKGSGIRIAGATFDVHEQIRKGRACSIQRFSPRLEIPATDAEGVAPVRGLAHGTELLLAVRAPGYPPPLLRFGVAGQTVVPGDVTECVVELETPRTIRWPIVPKEDAVPPPAAGTEIRLRAEPGSYLKEVPSSGVMEDGALVVAGWGSGPAHGIAIAPDGSLARLWAKAGTAEGTPTCFRAPRHIDVVAKEPDGRPVARAAFEIRNQGNHAMAPIAFTDGDGRLRFESLYGYRADVYHIAVPELRYVARRVGTVDLERGSGTVEVTLQPEREIRIRVLVDGRPQLPPQYNLSVDRVPMEADEDPRAAELAVTVRPAAPDGKVQLAMRAPGYVHAEAVTTERVVTFELQPEGALVVEIAPPADGRLAAQLERWSGESWVPARTRDVENRGGTTRYGALPAGRYRVRDTKSGAMTEEVEVVPGAGAAAGTLDLSRAGEVKGRVEAPVGTDMSQVEVRVDGKPASTLGVVRSPQVRRDGTFALRVSGDRETTLQAFHPLLRASEEIRVTAPRSDVVLRLAAGPTATFIVDRDPNRGFQRNVVRVLLYRGEVKGEPLAVLTAKREERRYTFGGFEPGRYTVWIDTAPFAPVVLRGVDLAGGANDLGTAAVHDGAGIRVEILVKEGQSAPRIYLFASRITEPRYTRGLNSNGEAAIELRGLGAGRFSVLAAPIMGGPSAGKGLDETVELDGKSTCTFTLDLRK